MVMPDKHVFIHSSDINRYIQLYIFVRNPGIKIAAI